MDTNKILLRKVKSQGTTIAILSAILIVLVFDVISRRLDKMTANAGVSVSQEANPEFITNVNPADQTGVIRERAQRRGYFTREEFAELMGFSTRTLDRRIEEGRLSPPPFKDEAGNVVIDLDTEID